MTFDWKDFQRDGQPFPAPDLHARPAGQLVVRAVGETNDTVLVDQDLRPADIACSSAVRFIWRDVKILPAIARTTKTAATRAAMDRVFVLFNSISAALL